MGLFCALMVGCLEVSLASPHYGNPIFPLLSPPVVRAQIVSRHCQISLREQNCPLLRTTDVM